MPATPYDPPWKKYEADLHHPDPKVQSEALENFTTVRDEALRTDSQARRWEASRRAAVAKDKPHYVKEKRQEAKSELDKLNVDLRSGGIYETGLRPAPGYIIIQIETPEEKTKGGIFITVEAAEVMQNVGRVVDIGNPLPFSDNRDLELPCQIGDKVMFKKGAGIELSVENKNCRFMLQSDILGVFYDP